MEKVRRKAGRHGWRVVAFKWLARFNTGWEDVLMEPAMAVIDARALLWEVAKGIETLVPGSQRLQVLGAHVMVHAMDDPLEVRFLWSEAPRWSSSMSALLDEVARELQTGGSVYRA